MREDDMKTLAVNDIEIMLTLYYIDNDFNNWS